MKTTTRRQAIATGLILLTAAALLYAAPDSPPAPDTADATAAAEASPAATKPARASGWVGAQTARTSQSADGTVEARLPTREERLAARDAQDLMAADSRAVLYEHTLERLDASAERAEKMGRPEQAALMRRRAEALSQRFDAERDTEG